MSGMMLTVMLVLFAISVPVAVAIGLAAIIGIQGFTNFPLIVAAQQLFVALDKFPLAAIPFFILAGNLMNVGGTTQRIFRFARALVGHFNGGLGQVSVISSMIFSGMSGSSIHPRIVMVATDYPLIRQFRSFQRGDHIVAIHLLPIEL
jgi:TRAP-type mannitol/chloroaromatic compound transport system permease large subunit